MEMRRPINRGAALQHEAYVIAGRRADGWRVIESQPNIRRAMKARQILADHDRTVGAITQNDDVRIFRTPDVCYTKE